MAFSLEVTEGKADSNVQENILQYTNGTLLAVFNGRLREVTITQVNFTPVIAVYNAKHLYIFPVRQLSKSDKGILMSHEQEVHTRRILKESSYKLE